MLHKRCVRDDNRRIIWSITTGYSDSSSVARDEHNKIAGRTNERLHRTRYGRGSLVSVNSSDTWLPDRSQEVTPRLISPDSFILP
jgi:hypothetical protein